MLYIITEDSTSARDFWECVAETFRGPQNYVLVQPLNQTSGNTTLNAQVSNLFPKLKAGDTLLVAFDNIGATKGFNSINFIRKVGQRCAKHSINFRFTSYYCFEELYLSYMELFNMISPNTNPITLNALKYVNKCIGNSIDYFSTNSAIQDFINKHHGAGKNREHFANALLTEVAKTIKGHFMITKAKGAFDGSAECWLRKCNDIQSKMNQKQAENICGKYCKYCCKNMNTRDKLMDLNNKSLCRNCAIQLYQI